MISLPPTPSQNSPTVPVVWWKRWWRRLPPSRQDRHPVPALAHLQAAQDGAAGVVDLRHRVAGGFGDVDLRSVGRPQDRYLKPDFVIDVSEFVEQKFDSIKAYKTQFWDPDSSEPKTPISGEEFFEFLRGRMAEFGRSIGVRYAEGYTVERTLGVDSLFQLR